MDQLAEMMDEQIRALFEVIHEKREREEARHHWESSRPSQMAPSQSSRRSEGDAPQGENVIYKDEAQRGHSFYARTISSLFTLGSGRDPSNRLPNHGENAK